MPRAFSGTMLSAVAVLAPGHLEYDRDRASAWFPLYRLLPTAPLFSMADGQSYGRGTNCSFTKRTKSPAAHPLNVEDVPRAPLIWATMSTCQVHRCKSILTCCAATCQLFSMIYLYYKNEGKFCFLYTRYKGSLRVAGISKTLRVVAHT